MIYVVFVVKFRTTTKSVVLKCCKMLCVRICMCGAFLFIFVSRGKRSLAYMRKKTSTGVTLTARQAQSGTSALRTLSAFTES